MYYEVMLTFTILQRLKVETNLNLHVNIIRPMLRLCNATIYLYQPAVDQINFASKMFNIFMYTTLTTCYTICIIT